MTRVITSLRSSMMTLERPACPWQRPSRRPWQQQQQMSRRGPRSDCLSHQRRSTRQHQQRHLQSRVHWYRLKCQRRRMQLLVRSRRRVYSLWRTVRLEGGARLGARRGPLRHHRRRLRRRRAPRRAHLEGRRRHGRRRLLWKRRHRRPRRLSARRLGRRRQQQQQQQQHRWHRRLRHRRRRQLWPWRRRRGHPQRRH